MNATDQAIQAQADAAPILAELSAKLLSPGEDQDVDMSTTVFTRFEPQELDIRSILENPDAGADGNDALTRIEEAELNAAKIFRRLNQGQNPHDPRTAQREAHLKALSAAIRNPTAGHSGGNVPPQSTAEKAAAAAEAAKAKAAEKKAEAAKAAAKATTEASRKKQDSPQRRGPSGPSGGADESTESESGSDDDDTMYSAGLIKKIKENPRAKKSAAAMEMASAIRNAQKDNQEAVFSFASVSRLCREVVRGLPSHFRQITRFTRASIVALNTGMSANLVPLFEKSQGSATSHGRKTVQPKDMQLTLKTQEMTVLHMAQLMDEKRAARDPKRNPLSSRDDSRHIEASLRRTDPTSRKRVLDRCGAEPDDDDVGADAAVGRGGGGGAGGAGLDDIF